MNEPLSQRLIELSVDITTSYVASHRIPIEQVTDLISEIYKGLSDIASEESSQPPPKQEPAVPIKKSVTSDYIICLEDGRKFKSIKRHILSKHGLTPSEYRAKWDLSSDYPMVAPSYSVMRSALAKELGLGFDRLPDAKRAVGRPGKQRKA